MQSLPAGMRHLVPRRVRERFFPLYAIVAGRSDAFASWLKVDPESEVRRHRRTDLIGELFDQRMLRLEARLVRVEDQLAACAASARRAEDALPLSDSEYLAFESDHRGSQALIEDRFGSVAAMLAPGSDVLDLGSGTGTFLRVCREQGHRAVGVDSSEAMVRRTLEAGLQVTLDDACRFLERQPDAYFDCVTAFHLVEHLPGDDLRALFGEVHRALRPAGQFVIETPNVGSSKTMLEHYFVDPSRRRPRRVEQYVFALQAAGFSEVKVEVLDEPGDQSGHREESGDRRRAGAVSSEAVSSEAQTLDELAELECRLARLEARMDVASEVRIYAHR